jgi:hypothetical protein
MKWENGNKGKSYQKGYRMKNVWLKKMISVTLAAGMSLALTACSGRMGDSTEGVSEEKTVRLPDTARFFRVDYLNSLPDGLTGENVGSALFSGDRIFYTFYNDDYTEQTICSYDILTGENVEYSTFKSNDGSTESSEYFYLSQYTADTDGNLLLITTASQYEGENSTSQTYLTKVDITGVEVYRKEIEIGPENSYCSAIRTDSDGNVYLAVDEWTYDGDTTYVLVFDDEGNGIGQIENTGEYIYSLANAADGRCGYLQWGADEETYVLQVFDPVELKVSEEIAIGSGYVYDCAVLDDHTYLYRGDDGLKQYDTDTQESSDYINWDDYNIPSSSVNSFGVLSDGRIAVYLQTWGEETYTISIAVLDEIGEE